MIRQKGNDVVVYFGLGTTFVSGARKKGRSDAAVVLYPSQKAHVVGQKFENDAGKPVSDVVPADELVVYLHFRNIDGLDVLLDTLTEVRSAMQKKPKKASKKLRGSNARQ